jgi:hypothetical protein
MPVRIEKPKKGARGKVKVRTPGGVKSKGSTQENAIRQKRLLDAIEHGFKPTGKPASQKASQRKARETMKRRIFS